LKKLIISDATPIIAFSRIGKLELLHQIVGEILIPEEVSRELFEYKKADVKSIKHCKWIHVGTVKSRSEVELLMPTLDRGESEVTNPATIQETRSSKNQPLKNLLRNTLICHPELDSGVARRTDCV